jgi:hypothetical protein
MATSQNIKKGVRSGKNVGTKPQSLTLVNEDPDVREYFERSDACSFVRKSKDSM